VAERPQTKPERERTSLPWAICLAAPLGLSVCLRKSQQFVSLEIRIQHHPVAANQRPPADTETGVCLHVEGVGPTNFGNRLPLPAFMESSLSPKEASNVGECAEQRRNTSFKCKLQNAKFPANPNAGQPFAECWNTVGVLKLARLWGVP
jgi:hypothetical protein